MKGDIVIKEGSDLYKRLEAFYADKDSEKMCLFIAKETLFMKRDEYLKIGRYDSYVIGDSMEALAENLNYRKGEEI